MKDFKNSSLKIFFYCFIGLLTNSSTAQNWELVLEVSIQSNGKALENGSIILLDEDSVEEKFFTSKEGRADLYLKPDNHYKLIFTGESMVEKRLEVSTYNVPKGKIVGKEYFLVGIDLFKRKKGTNVDILEYPIGYIFYNSLIGGFDSKVDANINKK